MAAPASRATVVDVAAEHGVQSEAGHAIDGAAADAAASGHNSAPSAQRHVRAEARLPRVAANDVAAAGASSTAAELADDEDAAASRQTLAPDFAV